MLWPQLAHLAGDNVAGESMWLEYTTKDFQHIGNWTTRANIQPGEVETEARGRFIRDILARPRDTPTVVFFVGHTIPLPGGPAYVPADSSGHGPQVPIDALYFSEMRQSMLMDPNPSPLLLVTDFCDCDNILGLPYVLRRKGNTGYWEETGCCVPSEWPQHKEMLHFAATSTGESAHEFESTGGIFTDRKSVV